MDPGRPREGDPGGLRGEPRGAGRPPDRPLPHPCAGPGDAVEDISACARAARGRRPREACRRRQRQPAAAGRGARACPITAVQVALSVYDDSAVRGGVVERCEDAGVAIIAHSPLGGTHRAGRLVREGLAEAALAWLLELSPAVVAIPGARRPETARSAARAATLELSDDERAVLGRARPARPRRRARQGDVVVVMGIPGAGKSRVAEEYVSRGYVRLNRDERGGTLRGIAAALEEQLSSGVRRVVLDNTYLTRATRSYVIEVAGRHGVAARCIWLDTPLAQAQVNLVERLLERFGHLPAPEELQALAKREPGVMAPTSQMRAFRELEPPYADEGFAKVEHVPFARLRAGRQRHDRQQGRTRRAARRDGQRRAAGPRPHARHARRRPRPRPRPRRQDRRRPQHRDQAAVNYVRLEVR